MAKAKAKATKSKIAKSSKSSTPTKHASPSPSSSLLTTKNIQSSIITTTNNNDEITTSTPYLSRGQRKRQVKKDQRGLKKQAMILSSLRLQKLDESKNKIDGFECFKEAIDDITSNSNTNYSNNNGIKINNNDKKIEPNYTSNKSKQSLLIKEISHMNLVLQHPTFQSNPFATIQQHLRNTNIALQQQQQTDNNDNGDKVKEDKLKKKKQKKINNKGMMPNKKGMTKKFKSRKVTRVKKR